MPRFAKFCWFVLAWTILVILWGAFVRATGSGAGCGSHWPLCNGMIIPQSEQVETSIEFTHRLLSGVALLLIFAMLIWGWKVSDKGHPVRKGLIASTVLIITEALLGAGLVLFELVAANQSVTRAVVMAFHLLNTFLLLAAITLSAWWASTGKPIVVKNQGKIPFWLILALVGVALIGMSGAITALGDTLFPAESLAQGLEQDSEANAHFLIRLRIYHPLIAILVGAYILLLVKLLRNRGAGNFFTQVRFSIVRTNSDTMGSRARERYPACSCIDATYSSPVRRPGLDHPGAIYSRDTFSCPGRFETRSKS